MSLRPAVLVASMLALSGCGYALVGHGMVVDPTIKRIGVPLFRDTTGRPGLDQKVTQKVIEELLKRGRFDVVQESAGVDAVVDGELTSYREDLQGIGGVVGDVDLRTQGGRFAITLTGRVKYSKTGKTEPIWSTDSFSRSDSYDADTTGGTLVDSDQAVDRLVSVFARELVAEMLEAF
jgi:hypothetical protein